MDLKNDIHVSLKASVNIVFKVHKTQPKGFGEYRFKVHKTQPKGFGEYRF
jgi:hypothetical protein